MNPIELRNNVETIVIVMFENRSFDNVLGHLRHPAHGNRQDVNGIGDLTDNALRNPNTNGIGVAPFFATDAPLLSDLPHDSPDVAKQLAASLVRGTYAMNGFVRAFEEKFHSLMDKPPVMGLLTPPDLPTTGPLADAFTICDNWFACLPTSTAPNRLMSMCGYTEIGETGSLLPEQHTVYHWLSDNQVRWRVYSAGLPFFALMASLAPLLLTSHFRGIDRLPEDLRTDPDEDWPQVIFVEPDYHDCPVHFVAPCDNHPPLPIGLGEAFLGQTFAWLRASPRWERMALFVTYDEHGGFFDHVPPLPVKYTSAKGGFTFDSTGPRVPAVVASPYARRCVTHEHFDNTSILQLLAERFGKGAAYSAEVANRHAQGIASASVLLDARASNKANPAVLTHPPAAVQIPPTPASRLTSGFDAAARELVARHGAEAIKQYPQLKVYR